MTTSITAHIKRTLGIVMLMAGLSSCGDNEGVAMPEILRVTLSQSEAEIEVGESVVLTAKLSSGKEETFTWLTSDAKVATVSDGTVKGISEGEATITAKIASGQESSCKVTVKSNGTTPLDPEPNTPVNKSGRVLGGDISMLPEYQKFGTEYKDKDGKVVDLLPFFAEQGMNTMRVRLFVNPKEEKEVIQNLEYVVGLSKQIKAAGMKLMLDFHYSDTWADPAKQYIPEDWKSLDTEGLTEKLYTYTKEVLATMVKEGAAPDYIQTGNEISYGMLWSNGKVGYTSDANWDVFCGMLKSAGKACREVTPEAKIILHSERSNDAKKCLQFITYMANNGVDYDIFGLSYYPMWHGKVNDLDNTLANIEAGTEKEIMIVEYAYNYIWYPSDAKYKESQIGYEGTIEGQKGVTKELVEMLNRHERIKGLFWWFPEENECPYTGILTGWTNRGLFDNETGKALPALYELTNFVK